MEKKIEDYLHLENQWKNVLGYARKYQISNIGRYKGQRRASFGASNNYEYKRACFWNGEKYVFVMIHRLVAKAFIPNPENKPHVNHKNGIKWDNRSENLEWATIAENAQHAYDTGLRKANPVIGCRNYKAKLDDQKVVEIRNSTLSQSQLSEKYSVSKSVIQKVKEKKSWKHVK